MVLLAGDIQSETNSGISSAVAEGRCGVSEMVRIRYLEDQSCSAELMHSIPRVLVRQNVRTKPLAHHHQLTRRAHQRIPGVP